MDNYIFVHAGLESDKTHEETDHQDLVWIRDKFHEGHRVEKLSSLTALEPQAHMETRIIMRYMSRKITLSGLMV